MSTSSTPTAAMSSAARRRSRACFLLAAGLAFLPNSCASLSGEATGTPSPEPQASDAGTATVILGQTLIRATAVATLRQPVSSTAMGLSSFWHRSRGLVVGSAPVSMSWNAIPSAKPGSEAFERFLDEQGLPARELGRVRCLPDGPEFFGELDRQLAAARESVDVQVYIFDNDDIGVKYARKLGERSASVRVRVMFDDMGTNTAMMSAPRTPAPEWFSPPGDMGTFIERGSQVEVRRTLNPWLVADHTKLLIFDDRTAILGGMNIGREYFSEWHDLMIRVEGPVVGSLARDFEESWTKAGPWGDFAVLQPQREVRWPEARRSDVPLRILRTDAAAGRSEVLKASIAAMHASRERIWIQNPYFASDRLVRAAQDAARRGVDVRVILPAENDSPLMEISNLATAGDLISAGVKVYHYPRMTHLKAMICDDWATVGSANLDILSMRLNRELNLAFSDRSTVDQLAESVFRPDFKCSRRIRRQDTEVSMANVAETLADQL